ncbi:ABC transporter permease [Flexithrix dorotheae]|uniref:ABC transporter permease n=1 Tax=Flexithrix dorotheae TaxID=70993 RepID=UPI00038142D2|nr:ABC transporter permease [Flexithrix dorotheae]
MFKNYLKVAFTNLWNHKVFSFINILGLTVGMAACFLILLFVQDELSYDQYHEKADRLYRVFVEYKNQEGEFVGGVITPYILGPTLASVFEGEVERVIRIDGPFSYQIEKGDKKFPQEGLALADADVFDAFSFKLIAGDPKTALVEPFTMVIDKTIAEKFFGKEDPIGESLLIEEEFEVKITGIIDEIPENSHAHFHGFVSMASGEQIYSERVKTQWGEGSQSTYLVLPKGANAEKFEAKLPDFVENHTFGEGASAFVRYRLQKVTDIHLHSHLRGELEANGDIDYIYIFSGVALVIMLIACINYMNLSTARSSERAKEVGLRKVVGAYRSQIITQFLSESILLTLIAFILAILCAEIALPVFNEIAQKELEINYLENFFVVTVFLGIAIVIGIVAGSYPAFFLSSFQPVKVLKGSKGSSGGKSVVLRKVLVILQFAISITLIISTIVISEQLNYLRNKKLGINTDHIVISNFQDTTLVNKFPVLKRELLKNPDIKSITATNKRMTRNLSSNLGYKIEGAEPNPQGQDNYTITTVTSDHDFFKTYEAEFVMGRDFDETIPSDAREGFIFNESAIKLLGLEDPIGKEVESATFDMEIMDFVPKKGKIIGVVKDFHFESLDYTISPVGFHISDNWLNWMSIKLAGNNIPETVQYIESTIKSFAPTRPFNYTFLDEDINQLYQGQERVMIIFRYFAGLAIIIACLGIFGLSSFTAERKTKEIGIRKVLGASTSGVTILLTREFIKLVVVAAVIGWPIAYYFMDSWLTDFNYRIDIGFGAFILATFVAIFIAVFTVSSQAIKAALTNPVKALRYE